MESVPQAGFTFQNLLPFILAVLLIFLIPMLMRRYGLTWDDITRMLFSRPGKRDYSEAAKAKKREPWQANSRSQDLQALVSTLLMLARKEKLGLVYPGTVQSGGKTANLVALVVTRDEVVGVNCFGFGGTVTENSDGAWNQHMNGQDQPIPDPLAGNRQQQAILRGAMDAAGLCDVPLRMAAVFTSRTVTVQTAHPEEVFDVKGFVEDLRRRATAASGSLLPDEIARQLNTQVVRMKPGAAKKRQ